MNKLGMTLAGTLFLSALAVPIAPRADAAAPAPGACGPCGRGEGRGGGRGAGMRHFDAKTVTTIHGDVVDVERVARRRHEGVHLVVAMGSERLTVHLGPSFYVDAQALKLAKGDRVEVKGSRTTFGDQPVLLAQEVRKGSEVLPLRDATGVPLWRGQGAGR